MKKKILLTLILVFMFFIGNMDIVEANWVMMYPDYYSRGVVSISGNDVFPTFHCMSKMDFSNTVSKVFDMRFHNANGEEVRPIKNNPVLKCYYPAADIGEDDDIGFYIYSNKYAYKWYYHEVQKYENKAEDGALFVYGSPNGTMHMTEWYEFAGSSDKKGRGLSCPETYSLFSSGEYVCPIVYATGFATKSYFGVGSSSLESQGYVEFVAEPKNGAKVCLGSRTEHDIIDKNIEAYNKHFLNGGSKTSSSSNKTYTVLSRNTRIKYNSEIKSYFDFTKNSEEKIEASFKNEQKATDFYLEKNDMLTKIESLNESYAALKEYTDSGIFIEYPTGKTEGKSCSVRCGTITDSYCQKVENMDKLLTDDGILTPEELNAITNYLKEYEKDNNIDDNDISDAMNDYADNKSSIEDFLGVMTIPELKVDLHEKTTCSGILDDSLKEVIKWVLNILRLAIPILLIILCTIDFGQAMISQEQDEIKKATSKVIKRIIAALVVFLIPTLVNMLLDMPGISDYTSDTKDCNNIIFGNFDVDE